MRIFNTILIALLLSACATPQRKITLPSQELRNQLGVIQLTTTPLPSQQAIDEPSKGIANGAAEGTVKALDGFYSGCCGSDPGGAVLAVLLLPVVAIVGAGTGLALAHSEEEVNKAVTTVNTTLGQYQYEKTLADVCLQKTNRLAGQFYIGSANQFNGSNKADTELLLSFMEFRWYKDGDIDPDLVLHAAISATLNNIDQKKIVYSGIWRYKSPKINFFDLSENNGRLLKQNMQKAIDTLCEKMAYDLFVTNDPSPAPCNANFCN